MTRSQVAVITGGASGIGLAVAKALSERGGWSLHLIDVDEKRGTNVAHELSNAQFYQTDISDYAALARTFQLIATNSQHQLDFVFANAGVIERTNFYQVHVEFPPEPDLRTLQVNLNGLIFTTYLALHYFRQSPGGPRGTNVVMTASCGGLYPSHYSPIYTASKYGVVGFMRSVAGAFAQDGIRVNAICPGIVQTNLVDEQGWSNFPIDRFIPAETVAQVVLSLNDGVEMEDATGIQVRAPYGRAVEISGSRYYFREAPAFCDQEMQEVMGATVLENQMGAILKG
ncbi:NAD(P)-binding protein [Aspergillus avenaceus]|uniref:NAD(P)-binding protein n=1 Tax=Aspergillus avenaceus TaxID=36643 RepID=A0A5N6TJQ5_ASPAV|nr:NAD(P)-binding protein [Aspergillus avenaceus]